MKVIAFDPFLEKANLELDFFDGQTVNFDIETISKEDVLRQADFITLHVPAQKDYVIDEAEFNMMILKQNTSGEMKCKIFRRRAYFAH